MGALDLPIEVGLIFRKHLPSLWYHPHLSSRQFCRGTTKGRAASYLSIIICDWRGADILNGLSFEEHLYILGMFTGIDKLRNIPSC